MTMYPPQPYPPPPYPLPPLEPRPGAIPDIGIAGFVSSLGGLVVPLLSFVSFVPGFVVLLSPLLGIAGLVLSIVGLQQANRFGMARGLSIAGLVIGIFTTIACVLVIFLWIIFIVAVSHVGPTND